MAKYYVECGDIKDVLNADTPMDACVCSVIRRMEQDMKNNKEQSCDLVKMFTVNEKGFVADRVPMVVDTVTEQFLDLETVFEELNKI
jgi:hypothetical protein